MTRIKLTAAISAIALAAAAFTSFVPAANADALPPMVGPAMKFIQSVEQQLTALSSTVAGFAESFTTNQLTFHRAQGTELDVQTLCIGETCIDEAQLQSLLAGESVQADTVPGTSAASTIEESPTIQVNGDNPAIIQVGDSYQDLGATITGPQADLNLGITTYVNGTAMSPVQIDTTEPATDTIQYVATDQNGLTSTSTRTVIVEAPPNSDSSIADSSAAGDTADSNTAATTTATSTAQ